MINWQSVIVNSFWILGLAVLLAAFSYHRWAAQHHERSLRKQMDAPSFQLAFWFSFCLIGVGLAGTSQRTWETAVWILFTLYSVANFVIVTRSGKADR